MKTRCFQRHRFTPETIGAVEKKHIGAGLAINKRLAVLNRVRGEHGGFKSKRIHGAAIYPRGSMVLEY